MEDITRYDLFHLRLSKNERRALELMAAREGRNLSEMTRELIREGAFRRGIFAVGVINQPEKLQEMQPA